MNTTSRIRAAKVAALLLVIGTVLEAYYCCSMFFEQGAVLVIRVDMGLASVAMGLFTAVSMLFPMISAAMAIGAAVTLHKASSEEHYSQARRMAKVSTILTIVGRIALFEFTMMLFLGLFVKKVVVVALVCGFAGFIITAVSHWVLLGLLRPYKVKKLSAKGYRRYPAIGAAVTAVFVAVAVGVNAYIFLPEMNAQKNLKTVEPFEAVSFSGEAVSSELLQGKVTILNIWETTCGPCKKEMPDLETVSNSLEGTNVQIVGLCYDTQVSEFVSEPHSIEEAQAILDERGVTYVNLQPSEELCKTISEFTTTFPTTVVLDENGQVLELIIGSQSEAEWTALAQKYIK